MSCVGPGQRQEIALRIHSVWISNRPTKQNANARQARHPAQTKDLTPPLRYFASPLRSSLGMTDRGNYLCCVQGHKACQE